jgi:hypothetical protein
MLSKDKLALIHVAKNKLNLSDEDYRSILAGFGVESSKDLTANQFKAFMESMKKLGFQSYQQKKYIANPKAAGGASLKQIMFIKKLWEEKSKVKTQESLEKFIFNITKKISLNAMNHKDCEKVINALENMK